MRQLWVVLALVACNKSSSSSADEAFGEGHTTPDYSAKKLVTQDATVEGLAFTIDVPEGLPRDKRQGGDWEDSDHKYDFAPKVFTSTIEIKRIQDLKEAKYHATLDANAKTWVREQSRPDSWALTYAEPDKTRIEAITYKQANDTIFIKCKAVQASAHGPLPSYAKTRVMLETICDSIKPKAAADTPPSEDTPEPVEKAPEEAKADDKSPEPPPAGTESDKGTLERKANDETKPE